MTKILSLQPSELRQVIYWITVKGYSLAQVAPHYLLTVEELKHAINQPVS